MASFRLEMTAEAERQIRAIGDPIRARDILTEIAALADEPIEPPTEAVLQAPGMFVRQVGPYRIAFSVDSARRVVVVRRVRLSIPPEGGA